MAERGEQGPLSEVSPHVQAYAVLVLKEFATRGKRSLQDLIFAALDVHDRLLDPEHDFGHPAATFLRDDQDQLAQLREAGTLQVAALANLAEPGQHTNPRALDAVRAMGMQRKFGLTLLHPSIQVRRA